MILRTVNGFSRTYHELASLRKRDQETRMSNLNSLFAGAGLAISMFGLSLVSGNANARPNCPTCLPGYYRCLESGATDCDVRYAVCLQWCPTVVVNPPLPMLSNQTMTRASKASVIPSSKPSAVVAMQTVARKDG